MWTLCALPIIAILALWAIIYVVLFGNGLENRIQELEGKPSDAGLLLHAYTRAIRYPLVERARKAEFLEKRGALYRSQGNLTLAYQDYANSVSRARNGHARLHLTAAAISVALNNHSTAVRHLSLIENSTPDEHLAAADLGVELNDAATVLRHASAILSAGRPRYGNSQDAYLKALALRSRYLQTSDPSGAAVDYAELARRDEVEPRERLKACSWLIDRAEAQRDATMRREYVALLGDIPPPRESEALDAWAPYFDRFVRQCIADKNGKSAYDIVLHVLRLTGNSRLSHLSEQTRARLVCMLAESAYAADNVPTAIQALRFAQSQPHAGFDERIRDIALRTRAGDRPAARRVFLVAPDGGAEVYEDRPEELLFLHFLRVPYDIDTRVLDLCQQAWLHSSQQSRERALESYVKAATIAEQTVSRAEMTPLRWIAKHMQLVGFSKECFELENREVATRSIIEQLEGCPSELLPLCKEAIIHANAGRHEMAKSTYDRGLDAIEKIVGLDARIDALMWIMRHLSTNFPDLAEECFVTARRATSSLNHTIPKLQIHCTILAQAKSIGIGTILTQYRDFLEESMQLAHELWMKSGGYMDRDRAQAQSAWRALYNDDPVRAARQLDPSGRFYGGPWEAS